jgi:plasmid stability protein
MQESGIAPCNSWLMSSKSGVRLADGAAAIAPVEAESAHRAIGERVADVALIANIEVGDEEIRMATLTIRNVEPELKEALRVRAAEHGRSMEAELRHMLKAALGARERRPEPNLAEAIRRRFAPLGGVDEIEPHPPVPVGEPVRFER